MGTPLLAALSMVEKKWSSTVRPVGRQSAGSASRKVRSTTATIMRNWTKPLRDTKERLHHPWSQWRSNCLTIKRALAQLDARHDEISDQQAAIEADIHNTITRLHETLDVRKTELISQLHQLTQAKLKSLAAQRDQIETTQAQLSSCLLFIRENLKTGNQGEVLMMKSTTVRQVKELTTTFQPDMLEPNTEANIIFSALADLTAECQNYGKVYAAGSPDPSKCCATGKGVDTAAVGEKSTAVLQTLNSQQSAMQGIDYFHLV